MPYQRESHCHTGPASMTKGMKIYNQFVTVHSVEDLENLADSRAVTSNRDSLDIKNIIVKQTTMRTSVTG